MSLATEIDNNLSHTGRIITPKNITTCPPIIDPKHIMISHHTAYLILNLLCWCLSSHGQQNVEMVECSICADPTHQPQDPTARFVTGDGNAITCQSAYDLGNFSLSVEDCEFWQWRGEGICHCSNQTSEVNNCTLCQHSKLPEPLREALPGKTCAEVQVDAKRDDPELCHVYQHTIGLYCNCTNEPVQDICRLCGTTPLPKPLKVVEPIQKSCVELEFQANSDDSDCAAFQDSYQDSCCTQDSTDPPINQDSSGSDRVQAWRYTLGLLLLSGLFPINLQFL
jgi:hypothetical protein